MSEKSIHDGPAHDIKEAKKTHTTLEQMLGSVFSVMAANSLYANKTLKELYERILPPVILRQFRLVRGEDGLAVAYVSWAKVDEHTEAKMDDQKYVLKPSEWKNGEIGLLMDVVAPNSRASKVLVEKLKTEVFPDSVLKAIRIDAKNKTAVWEKVKTARPPVV